MNRKLTEGKLGDLFGRFSRKPGITYLGESIPGVTGDLMPVNGVGFARASLGPNQPPLKYYWLLLCWSNTPKTAFCQAAATVTARHV